MWSSFKSWLSGILPENMVLQFIVLTILCWLVIGVCQRLLGVRDQPFVRILTLGLSLAGAYIYQLT